MAPFVTRIDEPSEPQQPHLVWPRTVWGLEIVRGQARQMFRAIPGPVFMIGTAADCDLVLADDTFPETYLYLYIKSDEFGTETVSVRRFGVGPELLVDEVSLDAAELPLGSILEFGPYAFRLTQRTSSPPGPGGGPGRDSTVATEEPFLPADFSAWEVDETLALDKVRALLAAVHASLQTDSKHQGLRLFAGSPRPAITNQPVRRQIA